ncbi:MAG: hypothetical protein MK209_00465 [Planctomycetes bacterium]|nr:hypothetical protein [Planctomycetota bacterium]
MLRTFILTFFGGLVAAAPLTAQECTSCPGCESATVATTAAQDEPSALAKGLAALAKKPFSFDMTMSYAEGENGADINGSMAFGDSKHFSMKVNIAMKEGETSQSAKLRLVADGTWLYYHVDTPELPAEMAAMAIGKVKLATFDELTQGIMSMSPMPVLDEKGSVSAATIDQVLAQSGLTISRDEKGSVNLSMDLPDQGPEGSAGKMLITLDGKNYMPQSLNVTGFNEEGEVDSMTMTFSNTKVLKDIKEFGENAWKFEVPEGTIINDMTAMLNMAAMQMMPVGGAEDELEF